MHSCLNQNMRTTLTLSLCISFLWIPSSNQSQAVFTDHVFNSTATCHHTSLAYNHLSMAAVHTSPCSITQPEWLFKKWIFNPSYFPSFNTVETSHFTYNHSKSFNSTLLVLCDLALFHAVLSGLASSQLTEFLSVLLNRPSSLVWDL